MQTKQELMEMFYNEYGYMPSDYDLREYRNELGVDEYPINRISRDSGISNEVRDCIASVAGSARNCSHDNDNLTEFCYMLTIFLCKTTLYFLIKSGHEKGFESINL